MSDRLTEIEARAKAATRGPWEDATGSIEPRGIWSSALFVSTATGEVVAGALCPDTGDEGMETPIAGAPPENRAFIAHARDDVPWLVAQVREQTARADAAEKATREAFVAGAKWWEFASTGGTMWGDDQHRAHAEAERRFPHAPVPWEIALQKDIDERDAEIARLRAERAAVWRDGAEAVLAMIDAYAAAPYRFDEPFARLADAVRAALSSRVSGCPDA